MSVQAKYTPLRGGLDLVTPLGQVNPGSASDLRNYEVGVTGGFRRVDGYERFDGQPAPHLGNTTEYAAVVNLIDGMTVGEGGSYPTRVVGTKATTAAELTIPLQGLDLTLGQTFDYSNQFALAVHGQQSGHYLIGEYADQQELLDAIEALPGIVSASVASDELTITSELEPDDGGDPELELLSADFQDYATYNDNQANRRAAIQAVPGDGPVLAVMVFLGKVLAIRDNAGDSFIYEATGSGWQAITLPATRLAGGSPQHVVANFTGNPGDEALYLVDGINPVLEIKSDNLTATEIADCKTLVGQLTLYPRLVEFHKGHLFVGYPAGSLQHSGIGDPFDWDTAGGAGEIAVGQPLRVIKAVTGDALGIFTDESVRVLYGTSAADWTVDTISRALDGVGAMAGTVQVLGQAIFADRLGLRSLAAVESYGNFSMSTSTALVKPLYDRMRDGIKASAIFRNKNQYRLFADGGETLIVTSDGQQMLGIGFAKYGFTASCATQGERVDGSEIVLCGAEDGFVYHLDVGTSFDGAPIDAALQLHFNHAGSPRNRKRFRKAVFDMDVPVPFTMNANLIFNYGGQDHAQHIQQVTDITGNYGLWNVSEWGSFYWGGQYMSEGEIDITGSGRNLSILLYCQGDDIPPFELNGLTLHYSVRKLVR